MLFLTFCPNCGSCFYKIVLIKKECKLNTCLSPDAVYVKIKKWSKNQLFRQLVFGPISKLAKIFVTDCRKA